MSGQPELIQKALLLHRAGRFEAAEQTCRQVLEPNSRQPDALHLLGVIALDTGRLELALDSIRQAVALEPTNPAFHLDLGHVHRALGNQSDAKACFERARELDPNSAIALVNLGLVHMEQQTLGEAEACYRQALLLQPGFAIAWNNLANVLITKRELVEARSCLEEAVRLDQAYAAAHNGLGTVWQRLGDLPRAQASFERAIAQKPDYATAHYNLGVVFQSMGLLDRAQQCYHQAVRLKPQFVEAYYQWAAALKQGERLVEAQTCLEHALRLRPGFGPALTLLASVLECFSGQRARSSGGAPELRAMAIHPSDALRIRQALLLPIIYQSQFEIDRQRSRLQFELQRLANDELSLPDPEKDLTGAPFFLAYQGRDDRALMERVWRASIEQAAPQLEFVVSHIASLEQTFPVSGQADQRGVYFALLWSSYHRQTERRVHPRPFAPRLSSHPVSISWAATIPWRTRDSRRAPMK